MGPRIGVPSAAAVPAIIPAVGLGLNNSDLRISRARGALPFISSPVIGVKFEVTPAEIKPELLRCGGHSDGDRDASKNKRC